LTDAAHANVFVRPAASTRANEGRNRNDEDLARRYCSFRDRSVDYRPDSGTGVGLANMDVLVQFRLLPRRHLHQARVLASGERQILQTPTKLPLALIFAAIAGVARLCRLAVKTRKPQDKGPCGFRFWRPLRGGENQRTPGKSNDQSCWLGPPSPAGPFGPA
jgi:hypothetical protein